MPAIFAHHLCGVCDVRPRPVSAAAAWRTTIHRRVHRPVCIRRPNASRRVRTLHAMLVLKLRHLKLAQLEHAFDRSRATVAHVHELLARGIWKPSFFSALVFRVCQLYTFCVMAFALL